jgi:type IX secretion system PorP/SprF family membrane protein
MKFRIFIVLVSFAFSMKAQHAYFSSLNQNLLSVNPAFAGTNKQLRAQVISGVTGMPKYGYNRQSYYAGIDFLGRKYSGFGLSFNYENYGLALERLQADFSYALHFTIKNKIKIVHACQVSFFQLKTDTRQIKTNNFDDLNFNGAFVWNEVVPSRSKYNADFSTGLLGYGKRFYIGISILSITQPDEGLLGVSKRRLTQIYQGKYKFLNPEKFNFDIYGFLKFQDLNIRRYDVSASSNSFLQTGLYLNYKVISFHLGHRMLELNDNNSAIIGFVLNVKGIKVGYNNRCNYFNTTGNTFFNEIYFSYAFGRNKKEGEGTPDNAIKLID